MNKIFYLFFAALFVFASCDKDEVYYPEYVGTWISNEEIPHYLRIRTMDEVSFDETGCYTGLFELGYYKTREDMESETSCQMRGFFKEVDLLGYTHKLEYYDASLSPTGEYFYYYLYIDDLTYWNESNPDSKTRYTRLK